MVNHFCCFLLSECPPQAHEDQYGSQRKESRSRLSRRVQFQLSSKKSSPRSFRTMTTTVVTRPTRLLPPSQLVPYDDHDSSDEADEASAPVPALQPYFRIMLASIIRLVPSIMGRCLLLILLPPQKHAFSAPYSAIWQNICVFCSIFC